MTTPIMLFMRVFDGQSYGAIVRTLGGGNDNYNLFDLSSTWGVEVETQDEQAGALLEQLNWYVGYTDNKDDGVDNNKSDVLLSSVAASDMTPSSGNGLPSTSVSFTLAQAVAALGLSDGEYNGGDTFDYRAEVVLTDGRTFSAESGSGSLQGSYFSSPYLYQAGMLCIPDVPFAGVYTVDMQDTYGDGWQTTTGDGGPGITVTLNDGSVQEIGLCSPYETLAFDCFPSDTDGTQTITIPVGTTSAVWNFPGDNWGEIEFQIYAPSGNLIASYTAGSAAGEIALNLCDE